MQVDEEVKDCDEEESTQAENHSLLYLIVYIFNAFF